MARPWRARSLRLLVYGLPIAGSLAFVQAATALTGTPTSSLTVFLIWWFAVSLAATAAVSGIYLLSRRLLPLGALLQLSLVFPDEAPSRFRMALRSGTVEELQGRLRAMREANRATDPQEAAETLLQLVAALDVHDRVTRGHADRVRAYAYALGKQLGLPRDDLDRLNWAALLHDIGKLDVSAEILNKPGRPSDEEWECLRLHPLFGETLVEPLRAWLGAWVDAVGYHHERWDGAGYPRGVSGEAIPIAGRIVAIVDVFDVVTSARSYKSPETISAAREEIVRCSGTQFDPRLVRAFVDLSLGRMRAVVGPISWLTHVPFLSRFPLAPSLRAALTGAAALGTATVTGLVQPHDVARAATPSVPHSTPVSAAVSLTRPQRANHKHPSSTTPRVHPHVATRSVAKPRSEPHDPTPPTVPASRPRKPSTRIRTSPPATRPAPHAKPAPRPAPPSTPPPVAEPPTTTTAPAPPSASPAPSTAPPPTTTNASPNTAPSFVRGANQSVFEDAGPQTVAGWASAISPGPSQESGQSVSFLVANDKPSLFSSQPGVAPDGTLSYTPAPNANGIATVTVAAHDSGGTAGEGVDTSASSTFTIAIAPVNDAPSFAPGGNQTAVSLLGPVTVPNWASGIAPGPADEAGQTVTFIVVVDKPSLFNVQPAIAPDGTLTYRPKPLAIGVATLSVRAVDNGGTANGGTDTSAVRTFTITII